MRIGGLGAVVSASLALMAVATPARGATVLGDTTPGVYISCIPNIDSLVVTTSGPTNLYTVPPSGGVITSWSFRAVNDPNPRVALRLFADGGAEHFTAVVQSPVENAVPNTLNTFPARIAAPGGTIIGLHGVTQAACYRDTSSTADAMFQDLAEPLGVSSFMAGPYEARTPIGAVLEPDADGDQFGDESQDLCPADATRQNDCVAPPAATIERRPKAKSSKRKATVEFASTETGVSFTCALDERAPSACESPLKLRRLKAGKHTLEIRSSDGAGNVSEPVSVEWKVVRKRSRG